MPLEILVFVVGASSLGAEIAAARLLAPWFGASTIVWANTIAIVLVALSIGYAIGGRLADRDPTISGLSRIVLVAAVLIAIVPFVSGPFLRASVSAFDNLSVGTFVGSLLGVSVLIAVPLLLLGMVSPYAVRLKVERVADAGRDRRAALRALDVRVAGRHVRGRAAADPVRRHPSYVPGVRGAARARGPARAGAVPGARARGAGRGDRTDRAARRHPQGRHRRARR